MRQIGLIILLFFTSLAYAQNVEFKASAPSVVAVGEQFKLEYTLNKEGDNLKVPTLEGFDLLMGPSVGPRSRPPPPISRSSGMRLTSSTI